MKHANKSAWLALAAMLTSTGFVACSKPAQDVAPQAPAPLVEKQHEKAAEIRTALEKLGFSGDDVTVRINQIVDLGLSADDTIELANDTFEDSLDSQCFSDGHVCSTCVEHRMTKFADAFGKIVSEKEAELKAKAEADAQVQAQNEASNS
jgi:hypothetical protein